MSQYDGKFMRVEIVLPYGNKEFVFGGCFLREDLILLTLIVYASKGNLYKPTAISYKNIKSLKTITWDVSQNEFFDFANQLSTRRGWVTGYFGSTGIPYFNHYTHNGWWAIYEANTHFAEIISPNNYMAFISSLLQLLNYYS